jgi:uncharacterized protein (DUF885 family)
LQSDDRSDTPAITDGTPAGVVHELVVADEESARFPRDRFPDLSLKALREREAQDRATLAKLHGVARIKLTGDDRIVYDLLEWRLDRRLEQFRLRLYLTPFWDDGRFVGYAGALGTKDALSAATGETAASFRVYVSQAIVLLR